MTISLEEAVKEVEFINSIGGINTNNVDHVSRIIEAFGEDAHEVLQEAAEDCRVLAATIVAEPESASAVQLS